MGNVGAGKKNVLNEEYVVLHRVSMGSLTELQE